MNPTRYQIIAQTIRERIASGRYTPGAKIPSIRQMALDLGYNKLTVHRAFEALRNEGLIENRVGSGSYVRFPEKINAPTGIFDFRTDYLDESLFPFDQVQAIFNDLFAREKAHALAPTPTEGDPGLLGVLSQLYHVPVQRMVIISGAQQGLDLVAKVFSAKISETMLFEDPTYPGAISLFKARHFVPLDGDGPDPEHLLGKLKQAAIRLFYTMPTVHNPTGLAYSEQKKQAVARLARQHDFYIVEDDFLSEFRAHAGPRFVDICPERTIHIKSLSQTTVAGIRLGFMVVPKNLFDRFLSAKFSSDIASFGLMQRCMREFLKRGLYQEHLHTIEAKIAYRKSKLIDLIDSHEHLSISRHQAGYSLWVKNDRPVAVSQVPWSRGEEFSFSREARFQFRLSFMHMDDAAFEAGMTFLERLWRQDPRSLAGGS
jgi:DNA-binding transcriptional MocR family regulator